MSAIFFLVCGGHACVGLITLSNDFHILCPHIGLLRVFLGQSIHPIDMRLEHIHFYRRYTTKCCACVNTTKPTQARVHTH